MTEPVAIRYNFDGYGYQYMDSGSGSDWLTRVDGEPLYAYPHPDNLGLAESIIKQQQAEIESLKDKLMLVKQSLEIVEGWVKK
jgi:hypothetical protein